MIIETVVVGPLETSCYILACGKPKEAAIIDPGDEYNKIKKIIGRSGLKPLFIINTHGHGDHIGANKDFGLPIYIHRLDADCLTDPSKNLSSSFFLDVVSPKAARLLEGGEKIKVGSLELEIIHTPGHTPGGICIKCGDAVFSGDTLFCGGVGRTDLPGGSRKDLENSIRGKILTLPGETLVCPGHGPFTTVDQEIESNPFLT